jgi:hypothetical protein
VWPIGTAAEEEEAAEAQEVSRKVSLLKVSLLKVSLLKVSLLRVSLLKVSLLRVSLLRVSLLRVSLLKVSRKPTQEILQDLTYCQPPKQNIYY